MSILSDCLAIAFESAASIAGVPITYKRGLLELDVYAIAGSQTVLQTADYENLIVKRHRESFLLTPSDLLPFFGEPQAGDQLLYTPPGRADIVLTFTIRPDEQNTVFRPTDAHHTRWRVNTLLTGKEDA